MPADPQKYWRLAERYLEEFFYPDPDLKAKFERYQKSAAGWSEFLYAYDEFYIVCDLMQWPYEELMTWVDNNCNRINELYEEVYGPEFKDVYRKRSQND